MSGTDLATTNGHGQTEIMERVIAVGDLQRLQPHERVNYYNAVCQSLGLNPFTRPFEYIMLDGRLTLYARKDATDQLRRVYRVSIVITDRKLEDGIYTVSARATMPDGRTDQDDGIVDVANLKGKALANACMKATTKAKRRVTLSICGLGWLDETETETIPGARLVAVEPETGEVIDGDEAVPELQIQEPKPWDVDFFERALQIGEGFYDNEEEVKATLRRLNFGKLTRDRVEEALQALTEWAQTEIPF